MNYVKNIQIFYIFRISTALKYLLATECIDRAFKSIINTLTFTPVDSALKVGSKFTYISCEVNRRIGDGTIIEIVYTRPEIISECNVYFKVLAQHVTTYIRYDSPERALDVFIERKLNEGDHNSDRSSFCSGNIIIFVFTKPSYISIAKSEITDYVTEDGVYIND